MMAAHGALHGVRILDLTRLLPGGVLTALLGDMGADVIKIEEPTRGDYMRQEDPKLGIESAASWIVGRNKRSLAIDLKDPAGVDVFMRLADQAAVIIESFRPGVADRLGIGFDVVVERNPAIVYASLSGYGSDGSRSQIPGHDINYISMSGVLGMTGTPSGQPCPPGVQVGDLGGATILGMGILAALFRAQISGVGDHVEVAMYDAAMAWTSIHAGELWASGHVPNPGEMLLNGRYPCYNVYECSDERFVAVGAIEEKFWAVFCDVIERPDLVERRMDPEARVDVGETLRLRPRDEWVKLAGESEACLTPVLTLDEALAHPFATERLMVRRETHSELGNALTLGTPVRFQTHPTGIRRPPTHLGADSVAVLAEAGFSPAEIDQLSSDGIVGRR